jgi:hypothetical protein
MGVIKMNEKISVNDVLMEVFNVVVFALSSIGAITIMVYIFKSMNNDYSIPFGFFKSIFIYIGMFSAAIFVAFTDILSNIATQKLRIIICVISLYVIMLLGFRSTRVNPFESVELFLIDTVWFAFTVGIALFVWMGYQRIVSNRYMEYISRYQAKLNNKSKS